VPGPAGPAGPAGEPAQLIGRFVELPDVARPRGRTRYFIVAAGRVAIDGRASAVPTFNNLKASAIDADGRVLMTWDGYLPPAEDPFPTIIKALPIIPAVAGNFKTAPLVVNFVAFQRGGFLMRVTDINGTPPARSDAFPLELMVEVSQYI